MSSPHVAAKNPAVMELEAGTYWWCACGQSKNQPWCDGSHKGSDFSPVEFVVEEARRFAMCQCKQSAKGCLCDGTHKQL